MRLNGILVGQLSPGDVERLLRGKVAESITLDYKRDLPGANDDARKEFLADVSALANTNGGVILFGIEEEADAGGKSNGVPASIVGVGVVNADVLQRELAQRVHDGLNPPLSRILFQTVEVQQKTVVALGIGRSPYAPHAVWFKKSGKFFRRNESMKYQVAPQELRTMFMEWDTWEQAAEEFRRRRVELILGRRVIPSIFLGDGKLISTRPASLETSLFLTAIQVLPLGRIRERVDIFDDSFNDLNNARPRSMAALGSRHTVNFDGTILVSTDDHGRCTNYLQAFRFGGLEYFTSTLHEESDGGTPLFNGQGLTILLRDFYPRAIALIKDRWGIAPPYAVMLTVDAIGRRIKYPEPSIRSLQITADAFQQPEMYFPPVIIEDYSIAGSEPLHDLLRVFWNAAGFPNIP